MGIAVLLAIIICFAAFMSARNFIWHRACARILGIATLLWGCAVAYDGLRPEASVEGHLLAMFAVPATVCACALILRWIFAPASMPIPVLSLRVIRFFAIESWRGAKRWSANFGVNSLP